MHSIAYDVLGCLEPYPDITYYIVLRRRPLFYGKMLSLTNTAHMHIYIHIYIHTYYMVHINTQLQLIKTLIRSTLLEACLDFSKHTPNPAKL
jgi:hypothetical protein